MIDCVKYEWIAFRTFHSQDFLNEAVIKRISDNKF